MAARRIPVVTALVALLVGAVYVLWPSPAESADAVPWWLPHRYAVPHVVQSGIEGTSPETTFVLVHPGGAGTIATASPAQARFFAYAADGTPLLTTTGDPVCPGGCTVELIPGTKLETNLVELAGGAALDGVGPEEIVEGFVIIELTGKGSPAIVVDAFVTDPTTLDPTGEMVPLHVEPLPWTLR
jgi:hypothetical protein